MALWAPCPTMQHIVSRTPSHHTPYPSAFAFAFAIAIAIVIARAHCLSVDIARPRRNSYFFAKSFITVRGPARPMRYAYAYAFTFAAPRYPTLRYAERYAA